MRTAPKRIRKRPRDPLSNAMGFALFGRPEDGTTLLITRRVGQVQQLPPGYELNTCGQCSSPVWVNRAFVDHYRRHKLKLRIECGECSE